MILMVLIMKVLQFLEHPDASQKVSILVCDSECNQTLYFKKILMKCQLIQFWKSVKFVHVCLYLSICQSIESEMEQMPILYYKQYYCTVKLQQRDIFAA